MFYIINNHLLRNKATPIKTQLARFWKAHDILGTNITVLIIVILIQFRLTNEIL